MNAWTSSRHEADRAIELRAASSDPLEFEEKGAKLVQITRFSENTSGLDEDWVAEEVPVALVYNGISHAVMMTTPKMLREFAVGFSLAEGIVDSVDDVYDVRINKECVGYSVELDVSSRCFWRLKSARRSMAGRTGCGLCGVESLSGAVRPAPRLGFTQKFDMKNYRGALDYLRTAEKIGARTGCTHSAAWIRSDGSLAGGAEDVGRHVALDKLLGLRARSGWFDGALAVSSRASYEMVQKAAMCGVEIIFAVSAPTTLAIEAAEKSRITLAAFCRKNRCNIYTHPERLIGLDSGIV